MAGRDSGSDLNAYVRHLIADAVRGGMTLTELSRKTGITVAHLSTIRAGKRGVGMSTLRGVATGFGKSLGELETEAAAWVRDHPQETTSEPRVEYDPRYPNLQRAAEMARLSGDISAEAVQNVQAHALKSDVDPSVWDWLDDMRAEERRLSRERRDPVGAEKARAEAEARTKRHLEELKQQPDFDARLAAAKAKIAAEAAKEEPARKTGLKAPGKKK